MSRNKDYIEKFDKAAGSSADFDSLFCFDGEDIIAKKRIRVRIMRKRAVFISSMAAALVIAVMGVCIGYISTAGLAAANSGETGLTSVAEGAEALRGRNAPVTHEDGLNLSSLIDVRYEYYITDTDHPISGTDGDLSPNMPEADAYIRVKVVSKSYTSTSVTENDAGIADGSSNIYYTLYPLEYFADGDLGYSLTILETDQALSVSRDFAGSVNELQPGEEYLIPFTVRTSSDGSAGAKGIEWLEFADNNEMPIRKTDSGWIVSDAYPLDLSGGTPVYSDVPQYKTNGSLFLLSNDELAEQLRQYYENRGSCTYSARDGISSASYTYSTVFYGADYESISISDDGKSLIFRNELYHSLSPGLMGTVVYAGENAVGSRTSVLKVYDIDGISTVIFTGLESFTVNEGDSTSRQTQIGTCSSEPVYCVCLDGCGNRITFYETDSGAVQGVAALSTAAAAEKTSAADDELIEKAVMIVNSAE
ncbi:MAG: hypothetical protein NC120_04535 [Ruminococcus sp.]|nr:hypothetical protein [Ruminococcus sp.]